MINKNARRELINLHNKLMEEDKRNNELIIGALSIGIEALENKSIIEALKNIE